MSTAAALDVYLSPGVGRRCADRNETLIRIILNSSYQMIGLVKAIHYHICSRFSHSMRSRVYDDETVGRPSVCAIIRQPHAAAAGLLLWARQE